MRRFFPIINETIIFVIFTSINQINIKSSQIKIVELHGATLTLFQCWTNERKRNKVDFFLLLLLLIIIVVVVVLVL